MSRCARASIGVVGVRVNTSLQGSAPKVDRRATRNNELYGTNQSTLWARMCNTEPIYRFESGCHCGIWVPQYERSRLLEDFASSWL